MDRFIVVNEKVVEKDELNLSQIILDNCDKVSKKIWYGYGGIPLLNENIESLKVEFRLKNIPVPAILNNTNELFRVTKRMLNKNKLYRSGYVLFRFYFNKKNIYSIFTSHAFPEFEFPFKSVGLLINFSLQYKNFSPFNKHRFFQNEFWKIARAEITNSTFKNSILLNENKNICESIGANIFMLSGNKIYTPSLKTGCFEDILRSIIIDISKDLNFRILESENISASDLTEMDEIFIASEATGIEWILGINNKRFVHQKTDKIAFKLNEYLKEKTR